MSADLESVSMLPLAVELRHTSVVNRVRMLLVVPPDGGVRNCFRGNRGTYAYRLRRGQGPPLKAASRNNLLFEVCSLGADCI